jgi:hypothetical protein
MTDVQEQADKLREKLEAIEGPDAVAARREQERAADYLAGVKANLAEFERQLALAKSDPNLESVARERELERLKQEVSAAKAEIKRVQTGSFAR